MRLVYLQESRQEEDLGQSILEVSRCTLGFDLLILKLICLVEIKKKKEENLGEAMWKTLQELSNAFTLEKIILN